MNPARSDRSLPMDRRTAIKWLVSALGAVPILNRAALGAGAPVKPTGYGPDPDLQKIYQPGELWPLSFTPEQRRTATVLCDTIIPAENGSPSASQVGVVDFIDEWISAPYLPEGDGFGFAHDRVLIVEGLAWLDGEGIGRFGTRFADLTEPQRSAICDDICDLRAATPEHERPARFFGRFRELTADGFYTTPAGTKDLRYVGNMPLANFVGSPLEVLKRVGLD